MKSFFKQVEPGGKLGGNKARQGKLYVSYRSTRLIDDFATTDSDDKGCESSNARNYKESVFSTSGGTYYINGKPAIFSQDNEAMLYGDELSEYY